MADNNSVEKERKKEGKKERKEERKKEFVIQSPCASVQNSELYAIFMVLSKLPESLNIVTESQYAERVVLHTATAEFVLDNSEFTLFCRCTRQSETVTVHDLSPTFSLSQSCQGHWQRE